jgi:hypothetical protein
MADTTINRFVGYGTTTQMNAFTPSPPSPASGPSQGYLWANHTTGTVWYYDFTSNEWVNSGSSGATGANPTATAGPNAVDGSATTFLRSDGAPAVQIGSASQLGLLQVDGTTITADDGVISAVGGGGGASYSAPNTSSLTWMNQPSGSTISNITGALQFYSPSQGNARDMAVAAFASYPATPFTKWVRLSGSPLIAVSDYWEAGLVVMDSSGKIVHFNVSTQSGALGYEMAYYTNYTTYSSVVVASVSGYIPLIGVNDDGTNLNFVASYDGVSLFTLASASRTAFLSSPSIIGLGVDAYSQNTTINYAHYGALPGPI